MTHEEKMKRAWAFIRDQQITDDPEEFKDGENMILVKNISDIQDAYEEYLDKKEELLKKGWDKDEAEFEAFGFDCVFEWMDSHGIKWEIKPEINWKNTKEFDDQDTIGEFKDGRFFWTWNLGPGKSAEELLALGESDGENGGKIFASREELLDYLDGVRDDLAEFVQEKF